MAQARGVAGLRRGLLAAAGLAALAAVAPSSAAWADHDHDGEGRGGALVVDVWINSTGGDAIDVYIDGDYVGEDTLADITREVASEIVPDGDAQTESIDAEFDWGTAQFEGRLMERSGESLVRRFDLGGVQDIALDYDFEEFSFSLCVPVVDRRINASVSPDAPTSFFSDDPGGVRTDSSTGEPGHDCTVWTIDAADEELTIDLELHPRSDAYWRFLSIFGATMLIVTALAGLGAVLLRRGPFRTMRTASLIVVLIATALATALLGGGMLLFTFVHAPMSNLVLADDLTQAHEIGATILPALLLALPALLFAVVVAKAPPGPFEQRGYRAPGSVPPAPGAGPSPPVTGARPGPGLPTWLNRD